MEAGIFSLDDARLLIDQGLCRQAFRLLVEVFTPNGEQAVEEVNAINTFLKTQCRGVKRILHGENLPTWAVIAYAQKAGEGWRIGMEDTLLLSDGRRCNSNEELYRHACAIGKSCHSC